MRMGPLRLAGAVAVLPPLPQQNDRLQSSRAVHMRSLAELHQAAAMHTHPDVVYGAMIPDPDYSDDDLENLSASKLTSLNNSLNNISNKANNIFNKNKSCSPPVNIVATNASNNLTNNNNNIINNTSSILPTQPCSQTPPKSTSSSPVPSSVATIGSSATAAPASAVLAPSVNMVARNNRVNAGGEDPDLPLSPTKTSGSPLFQQKENKNTRFDENGLVIPKKLINPSIESAEKKSLHREIVFNQKAGVNVLNQKTELQKAMDKHKGKQIAKEQEKEKQANQSDLRKALEHQALKLEQNTEKTDEVKSESDEPHEFQKLQAKLRSKQDSQ